MILSTLAIHLIAIEKTDFSSATVRVHLVYYYPKVLWKEKKTKTNLLWFYSYTDVRNSTLLKTHV